MTPVSFAAVTDDRFRPETRLQRIERISTPSLRPYFGVDGSERRRRSRRSNDSGLGLGLGG
jgi:hypothetical protein